MKKLSGSQENYLECIYRSADHGTIRVRDLAKKMGVQLPSVTRAVAGLVKKNLVRHELYGTIHLTDEGKAVGKEIVRRDICLSRLLVNLLRMRKSEADPLIHRLEHVIDESLLVRLEVLVDFALNSPAWVKRLQHRIDLTKAQSSSDAPYNVGGISVHNGSNWEKGENSTRDSD